jgi:cation transport regulator ChaC
MSDQLGRPYHERFGDPASRGKGKEQWGSKGNEADYLSKLRKLLAKMGPDDQGLLLHMAQKVERRS